MTFNIASAALGGHGDFFNQTGEYLAALGVQRALFVLDCGPLGMARHGVDLDFDLDRQPKELRRVSLENV